MVFCVNDYKALFWSWATDRKKIRRTLCTTVFFYLLHLTVPDEKHLKGRIQGKTISLKKLLPKGVSLGGDLSYTIHPVCYYPFGTVNSKFGIFSIANVSVENHSLCFIGILGTWFFK